MKQLGRLIFCVVLLGASGCRTCPIVSCHVRKVHMHGEVKYRGQPLWKKQNPAVGEKIKVYNPGREKHAVDKSKPLR